MVESERESLAASAGAYRSHRACIKLDHAFAIFGDSMRDLGDLTLVPELPVFVHEYVHYLQNYSTVAGISELLLWSHVLAVYSRSLTNPAATVPAAPAGADAELVAECIGYLKLLQGDKGPSHASGMAYKSGHVVDVDITLLGKSIRFLQTTLRFEDKKTGTDVDIKAGSILLNEGLAYEIECWVADQSGNAAPEPSCFPYGVLREVANANGVQHRFAIVALGILALNSGSPWPTLLQLFSEYQLASPEPHEVHGVIRALAKDLKGERDALLHILLMEEIPALAEIYKERGAVEAGMGFLLKEMRRMLRHRQSEPLFELGAFITNEMDFDELKSLLSNFPPCDVLQIGRGAWDAVGRDRLFSFHPEQLTINGLNYSDGVRALEAQWTNMMSHIVDIRIIPTTELQHHRERTCCPYFGACPLPQRVDNETQCADEPWLHYRDNPQLCCWYAIGIAGTLGTVRLINVSE